ncbi:MAG: serine/threonine protein kinase [Acidobacteria bacterium]|nr:serine/threonine protein kinase [Acidobacteriota bacterium]
MSDPTRPDAPGSGAEGDDRPAESRTDPSAPQAESDATIPDAPARRESDSDARTVETDRTTLESEAPSYDDLSADSLLRGLPRVQVGGRSIPSLHGIQLVRKLGQGAMGAVYLGYKPRLRQHVAIKVLPMHLAEMRPQLVERFIREAQLAASIESPHLIRVTDVDESEGLFFLVMEYVGGVSAGALLRSLRDSGSTLDEASALDICIAAGAGLAAAHARGIIHRDLKPDNILLPRHEPSAPPAFTRAKLADLGLARSEVLGHSLTGTDTGMGTAGYMAPEQALSARTAGKPADVFGLGATLYALLAVRPPFTGDSAAGVIVKTIQEPHTPIRELRADVSEPTATLIDRCLEKDPATRFVDASALLEALRACREALGERGSTSEALARLEALTRAPEVGEKVAPVSSPSTEVDGAAATLPDAPAASTFIQHASTSAQKAPTVADALPSRAQPGEAGRTRRKALLIFAFVLIALIVTGVVRSRFKGAASAPVAPVTTTVTLLASHDSERWARWAVDEFAKDPSSKGIQISVTATHGYEVENRLLEGKETPLLVALSNDLSSERFSMKWKAKTGREPYSRREVVSLSPQVFVMFEDRLQQYLKHYGALNFINLGDALTKKRWTAIGGPDSWGPFTFAIADPAISLNGLASAALASYDATGIDELLTLEEVRSPRATMLLAQLENAFRANDGGDEIMKELALKGPSEFDGVCTTESAAITYIESADDRWGALRVEYPKVNFWNESTVYVMRREQNSPEELAAANAFVDFLLGEATQQKLVALGLRPVHPAARLHTADSPFLRLEPMGIRRDVPIVLAKPSVEVVAELMGQ